MAFRIRQETRTNRFSRDPAVWILDDDRGNALEVSPAIGFNAYRWSVEGREMLYCNPQFFDELKPSRSGFPILYPFPNRIRAGRFTWQGRTYALPTNDPSGKNAIHGFVHVAPWQVLDHGVSANEAWITASVVGSRDAPDSLKLWPTDFELRVTYTLGHNSLRVRATARNPGPDSLPWGLGYHPYFRVEPFGGAEARIEVPAQSTWQLDECLPSGRKLGVVPINDLRTPRRFGDLQLDDVYSDLIPLARQDALEKVGVIADAGGKKRFTLAVSPEFREMVIFTPPHREAICLEPYTCVTDAINLQGQGVAAGLRTLQPGESWSGVIECRCEWT